MLPVPLLEDLGSLEGRSVLVRVDFNVPLTNGTEIADDLRIRAALPTLRWLLARGAAVTACTHLGRPQGQPDPRYSVQPVRRRLAELAPGVELLENLRFEAGETANDAGFAERLVAGHDAYVNDAFGASHRAHASIVGPPRWLPSAAGRLLAREVEVLGGLRDAPRRPFVAVLGGAKVSDKLGVIDALLEMVDALVIGGAMCFTFLKARGHRVGASLCEDSMVDHCRELLDGPTPIHLPYDLTALGPGGVLGDPGAGGEVRQVGADVPDGWIGVDIGPGSAAQFGGRDPRGGDSVLERPDGRVRGSPLRRRHRGGGRSHGRDPGLYRCGRGRQRGGSSTLRGRPRHGPRVHRRRSVAGADREGRPAGADRPAARERNSKQRSG